MQENTNSAKEIGKVLDGALRFEIPTKVYPLEAIYQAAYIFVDEYYIYLDKDDAGKIVVELRPKDATDEESLQKGMGEFYNELLAQVVRRRIAKQTGKLRELIVARALYGALGPEAFARAMGIDEQAEDKPLEALEDETLKAEQEELDRLLAEIEADMSDDTDDIATPWDEKFGKEKDEDKPEN